MCIERSQFNSRKKKILSVRRLPRKLAAVLRRLYNFLARRAYSVIMFGALFCTLAVKFFHSWRQSCVNEYFSWILADIAVLLGIEIVLTVVCFRWPRKRVIRTATIFAAVICTWSVMNAGLLIRSGMQILPTSILPLFRDPLNTLGIIGVNLVKAPVAAVILLGPSAIALTFFFFVLANPQMPDYSRKHFVRRIFISVIIVVTAAVTCGVQSQKTSVPISSAGLRYNCQLRAVTSFIFPGSARLTRTDLASASRKIPAFDQLKIELSQGSQRTNHNVVIVVLEGIQYRYTSLGDRESNLTPYLAALAGQGVEFANARSSVTHTTKVLFALLTGRSPSVSQDLAEAVPAVKPYAGIATILKQKLNFRTAFFQSAKGNFECRPGLVYNLGFDKFWSRDDLNDPDAFLGYLACDEFSMLKPIAEWIKGDEKPFFLTVLCSAAHDPYEVPEWFAEPAREPVERYRQAIVYTDKFIAALDAELARLNLTDKTILCVVGDHGEAFGEHGLLGHERIPFEEVLRIPWVMRLPATSSPRDSLRRGRITKAVSSVDLAPTLLAVLGFDINSAEFDGVNALGAVPDDRKVYFSGWMQEGPAGYVKAGRKFIYNPTNKMVSVYDLSSDPYELLRIEPDEQQGRKIADEIIAWRKNSVFRLNQQRAGEKMLFSRWLCRWSNRISSAKYYPEAKN